MPSTLPTKTVAGVTVPDSPLITSALNYVRERTPQVLHNHCVRSWLFGCIIASKAPPFADLDREVHAISVLFHDIGLVEEDLAPGIMSADKRFEVDGANAAREFIQREASAAEWDKHRLQLVWDSIALHATVSIALHKEVEVQAAVAGIFTDLSGPQGPFGAHVSREQWDEVCREYPRVNMKDAAREMLCNVCRKKPETTYDNFLKDFGEKHVEGYSAVGKRVIDAIENVPA